jgi:hypothetical protein
MKQIVLALAFTSLLTMSVDGQTRANAAIYAEKTAVMKVFNEYMKAMQADQKERDRARARLLTDDYFYMGVDGLPAGKASVMQRQKRNGLRINSMKTNEVVIRLYKNTAILTMRIASSGVDKGQAWGDDGKENGHATVMVKQKGVWRIAADIVGQDVENCATRSRVAVHVSQTNPNQSFFSGNECQQPGRPNSHRCSSAPSPSVSTLFLLSFYESCGNVFSPIDRQNS